MSTKISACYKYPNIEVHITKAIGGVRGQIKVIGTCVLGLDSN